MCRTLNIYVNFLVNWCEFEDSEDCFLFYNPDKWTGNFRDFCLSGQFVSLCQRMSGRRAASGTRGQEGESRFMGLRLFFRKLSGEWCVVHHPHLGNRSRRDFRGVLVHRGQGRESQSRRAIVASLKVRNASDKPVKEVIPVRILEINQINENYDWAVSTVKKQLTKDFTGTEADLENLQKVIDSGRFNPKQRQAWESFGTAFGVILVNEMDGMEWVTVIDGQKEFPALRFRDSKVMVNPISLIWDKAKSGQPCDLKAEFERIKNEVEAAMD